MSSTPLSMQPSASSPPVQSGSIPIPAALSGSLLPRSAGSASTPSSSIPSTIASGRNTGQSANAPFRPPSSTQHPNSLASTLQAGRRGQPTPTAAMAASGSSAVPSIFGFYSHDGYAGGSPSRTSASPGNTSSMRRDVHRSSTSLGQLSSSPRLGQAATVGASSRASAHQQQPTFEETTTISFTWVVRDLKLLREEVEYSAPPAMGGRSVSAGAGKSDVWTTRPLFGDGKWRLELIRTTRSLVSPPEKASEEQSNITVLSVYLTAMALDYIHPDAEIPASIMMAIRPVRQPVSGTASPHGGWTWRKFYDYTFSREAEFFTCHDLPSLSEMLQDPGIRRDDAFALTIQLGVGPGHLRNGTRSTPFEIDGHDVVPRALVHSLHGLMDDANSGDVRIVVRERGLLRKDTTAAHIVSYPVGSVVSAQEDADADAEEPWHADPEHVFVRDRVLWSHSSVLRNRSEYFATMLASDFSEGIAHTGPDVQTDRSVRTVHIPDADFVTVYWFLCYLYTQQIQFADEQDVCSAVLDQDWTVGAELAAPEQDDLQAARFEWTSLAQLKARAGDEDVVLRDQQVSTPTYASSTSGAVRARTSSQHGAPTHTSAPSSPLGPHRDRLVGITSDPHTHPTGQPEPASALSVFQLAHRYNMDELSHLASAHILASLTPDSAFPLLLATSMYTPLHQAIKTYVHREWIRVSQSPQFELCCDQVSSGIWGPNAGKTLRSFISSLVSPLL